MHLIEPLGFELDEKSVRRAGMDYRDMALISRWPDYKTFSETVIPTNLWSYSSKSTLWYSDVSYSSGDYLMFGSETSGLPDAIANDVKEQNRLHIPMQEKSRSLNLSNAVAIVAYEAWRQIGFSRSGT